MAQKSRLMSMTGESGSRNPEMMDRMGMMGNREMMDEEETIEEGLEDYSDVASYQPEEPEVAEPQLGLNALYKQQLQQADMYFNPVMDNPEIDESEREMRNPSSDPYAASMGLNDPTNYDSEYQQRMMYKDDAIASLQSKAQTRALATAKFQKLATKK